ncbi:hypothetical protein KR084_000952 [Drosophila pseudotakahashii]|nr:hypothetical protein KR084_000952 [Drosophila pseudotakahashii]
MNSYEIGLILLGFLIPYGHGLVHFVKLEPGGTIFEYHSKRIRNSSFVLSAEGGCKGVTGNDIKVGETEKDENTCGVYVCQNDRGDALIH